MKNLNQLHQLIADGYIQTQKHPSADLYIYNYTAQTQFEGLWNDWTLACRGLIMNSAYEVVARPFAKFFNLEELQNKPIPNEPFEVFEKVDGSLGILYWLDNKPFIATRGSFASEQAHEATNMLHTKYKELIPYLDRSKTYLFEIIYPENRIVVDYGNERKLVLLAIIDTQTGIETPLVEPLQATALPTTQFPIVQRYDGLRDIFQLKKLAHDNAEGFVVRFKNGFRLKVKFEEYVRIHRIMSHVSNKTIWEYLKTGEDIKAILERVPDEFYDWVRKTEQKFYADFQRVEEAAKAEFRVLDTRKETALHFQTCRFPAILFKMYENKSYDQIIWRLLKPKFEKPFANQIES